MAKNKKDLIDYISENLTTDIYNDYTQNDVFGVVVNIDDLEISDWDYNELLDLYNHIYNKKKITI